MVDPTLVPFLCVSNIRESIGFYETVMGFRSIYENERSPGDIVHAELSFEDCKIMIAPPAMFKNKIKTPRQIGSSSPITLHIRCKDVDAAFDRAVKGGAQIADPPKNMPWGERMFRMVDLDGYSWMFRSEIPHTPN